MSTPDTKKMSDLRQLVGKHVKSDENNSKSYFTYITTSLSSINTQSPIFYIIPSIVLIILLFFIKPLFLCDEHKDKDNIIIYYINYKKLIITSVIGGIVISLGLFGYFNRKSNNK
jgi:hypothetical protein